jgi:DNA-binding transcriptional ArsR family regulator
MDTAPTPVRRFFPLVAADGRRREISLERILSREYYRDMSSEESRHPGKAQATGEPAAPSAPPELRKVTDARTLRALAHPVRVALIEELSFGSIHTGRGMTATELGEAIGETPTTCSFHLRQLAKYGFVEEAGGGRGRARPWRMTSIGLSFAAASGDVEARIASDAAVRLFRERQFARYQTWRETKAAWPQEWQDAANDSEYTFYATPEELRQLSLDLHAQLLRFWERNADLAKRPPGALPVETLLLSFPVLMPEPAADE